MSKLKSFFIVMTITICILTSSYCLRSVLYPLQYIEEYKLYCNEFNIPLSLGLAVGKCESDFDSEAISSAGAVGVMQLMPSTAEYIAEKINYNGEINLKDYKINIMLACAYLSYLLTKFDTEKEAIMAYNAGEGRVSQWLISDSNLQNIPYNETKIYYSKVKYAKFVYDNIT